MATEGSEPNAAAAPAASAPKSKPQGGGKPKQKGENKQKEKKVPIVQGKKAGGDSKEIIGITASKERAFSQWYQEVVLKAELVDYYTEISGFYILRPGAMFMWNVIRKWFQERIDASGVEETSFPMFLSSKSLEKEKDHVEGFAPELAWVTKAGDKDLEVPVAVRPTSEAVMYPYYAKWIRSHRDLPLRLNQWNSVVRWEAKQTTPFLRAREFLWQEGHSAFVSEQAATKEVLEILEYYAGVYEQLLAVPVVRGKKTEAEKFAGGYWTTTCEAYIPTNGRGIQGATSHCLGQNFSKMFDIIVEDPEKKGEKINVWQNSWGLSTRVLGVMVMIHGDDKGLVIPPRVSKTQVVLLPVGITASTKPEDKEKHYKSIEELQQKLKSAGVRCDIDVRDSYTPAWKFNEYELKGVPLRLEFGPRDAAKEVVSFARRDNGEKGTIPIAELATKVPELLTTIQSTMYEKAEKAFREHRLVIKEWDKVIPALDDRNVVLIPFCEGVECEKAIKGMTVSEEKPEEGMEHLQAPSMGMKSLCIPFEQPAGLVKGETKCLNPNCGKEAKTFAMFGRSY